MPEALTSGQMMLLALAIAAGLLAFALKALPAKTLPSTSTALTLMGAATAGALVYVGPWTPDLGTRVVAVAFALGMLGALAGARLVRPSWRRAFVPPVSIRLDFAIWACAVLFGLLVDQESNPAWHTAAAVTVLVALGGVAGSNLQVVLVAMGVSPMLVLGHATGPSGAPSSARPTKAGAPLPQGARFCTACGRPLAAGDTFCTGCGAPVQDVSTSPQCSRCGTPFVRGQKFCRGCGARLG